jgi:outer membrane protein assembly factor BamB
MRLEAATGKKLPESSIPLSETIYAVHASPIVDKSLVYVSNYREMCALEMSSGKVRWKVDHGNIFRYYYPVLAGGLIYSVSVGAIMSNSIR